MGTERVVSLEGILHERKKFVREQAKAFRTRLDSLNLRGIHVSSDPEVRDSGTFCGRHILAISGINSESIAFFTALSNNSEDVQQVTPILLSPIPEGSGILIDETTGDIRTDSFWVCENGELKYIIPSMPITIDGFNPTYDYVRSDPGFAPIIEPHDRLSAISSDKVITKRILERAGIDVPRGVVIEPDEEPQSMISRIIGFTDTLSEDERIVLRGAKGGHGRNVGLFPGIDVDPFWEMVRDMVGEEQQILVEEKIIPKALTAAQKEQLGFTEDQDVDWTLRIIVSLDSEDPKVIDGEIRFAEADYLPVNLTHGNRPAHGAALDILDESLIDQATIRAEQASRAISQAALAHGEVIHGIAGVDLMVSQDGRSPVLELETSRVGGLGTLTRLNGGPLASIAKNVIPAWADQLERQHYQKSTQEGGTLRRLPHNDDDKIVIYDTNLYSENYAAAERILLDLGHEFIDQRFIMNNLFFIAQKTGNFDIIRRYLEEELSIRRSDDDVVSVLKHNGYEIKTA